MPGRCRKSHGHKKSARDKGPDKHNMGIQKCPCTKKGTDIDKKRERYFFKNLRKAGVQTMTRHQGQVIGPGKDRAQDRVVITLKIPEKDKILDCDKKTGRCKKPAMGPGRDWKPDGGNSPVRRKGPDKVHD